MDQAQGGQAVEPTVKGPVQRFGSGVIAAQSLPGRDKAQPFQIGGEFLGTLPGHSEQQTARTWPLLSHQRQPLAENPERPGLVEADGELLSGQKPGNTAAGAEGSTPGGARRRPDQGSRNRHDARSLGQLLEKIEILPGTAAVHSPRLDVSVGPASQSAADGVKGIGRAGQLQAQDVMAQIEFVALDGPLFGGIPPRLMGERQYRAARLGAVEMAKKGREIVGTHQGIGIETDQKGMSAAR